MAINSTSIGVMWDPPLSLSGVISGYIVYYRESDMVQTTDISSDGYTTVGVAALEYVIPGLTPLTNYTIHVQAVRDLLGSDEKLLGGIEVEILEQTLDTPTTLSTTTQPTPEPTGVYSNLL